jgi:FdrA protein
MPDTYRDSVFLMKLSGLAREESGALQVSAMMGTARNKDLFIQSGLSTPEVEAARPDDLIVSVQAEATEIDSALDVVKNLLEAAPSRKKSGNGTLASVPQTIDQALAADKDLNLALISVAGDYARYEAAQALRAGLDVMLYSDNISTADELALKTLAVRKKRLVMGPDCGTAIINGVPLAFANTIRRGSIGLIAASGTGLQEVACLLDRFGVGLSQAYGTGGRDMKDAIGGITTLTALDRLLEDPNTQFIGILGKPPGEKTRQKLLERIKGIQKPVAVHFVGTTDYSPEDAAGIGHGGDLTAFALLLARQVDSSVNAENVLGSLPAIPQGKKGFLRGLFSGGTLCQEAAELAAPVLQKNLYSNLSVAGYASLSASEPSRGNAFWDFGDDAFTVGRPHPMMAPELRMERLVRELLDPEVSVVLLDIVIGYGAATDQAELVVEALRKADRQSHGKSREKVVVASVCGTEGDVPSRSMQARILFEDGVIVPGSNAQAVLWAAHTAAEKAHSIETAGKGY